MPKAKSIEKNDTNVVEEIKYSKSKIVSSKKYASNRDLLQVLLEDNKSYTFEEVKQKINKYKKRKV